MGGGQQQGGFRRQCHCHCSTMTCCTWVLMLVCCSGSRYSANSHQEVPDAMACCVHRGIHHRPRAQARAKTWQHAPKSLPRASQPRGRRSSTWRCCAQGRGREQRLLQARQLPSAHGGMNPRRFVQQNCVHLAPMHMWMRGLGMLLGAYCTCYGQRCLCLAPLARSPRSPGSPVCTSTAHSLL